MTATGDTATSKLELIMGRDGLARLADSTVMVLGVGGVGSNCVEALARGGVGRLIVVDHDVVQASNINRQAIAFRSTIGRKKVDVARAMIADINPEAQVEALDRFVLAEDVPEFLDAYADRVDYVANKLRPEAFRFADVFDTVNCPLCRIMRKEARKRGIRRLRVLYSCEQPVPVPVREGAERRERSNLGTASFVPPIMGQMIAGEVLCALAGVGAHAGEEHA